MDHDIISGFKHEVRQACNLPAPIPTCLQLLKPENCICPVCLHQASSQWDTHTHGFPLSWNTYTHEVFSFWNTHTHGILSNPKLA